MSELQFPKDFLWGASISAHQVEGGVSNDWTQWEAQNAEKWASELNAKQNYGCGPLSPDEWAAAEPYVRDPLNYISGDALRHYEKGEEDIKLAQKLGIQALRFSVEWSRIEPEEGVVDEAAVEHYVKFTRKLINSGIQPIVTLHHFTNPLWFANEGGWERHDSSDKFTRYVRILVEALHAAGVTGVKYIVINEPEVYAMQGWGFGVWPPEKKNYFKSYKVMTNLIHAYSASYEAIKEIDPIAQVTASNHIIDFEPKKGVFYPLNKLAIATGNLLFARRFQKSTEDKRDFTALNHYLHCVVDVSKIYSNRGLFKNDSSEPRTDMGWYVNPPSLYRVLMNMPKDKPILITENGFALRDDTKREQYLVEYLKEVHHAIRGGAPVIGYCHWSLLDGFEWPITGWWGKFGLVAVNRKTMARSPKPSALLYKRIAAKNSLPD